MKTYFQTLPTVTYHLFELVFFLQYVKMLNMKIKKALMHLFGFTEILTKKVNYELPCVITSSKGTNLHLFINIDWEHHTLLLVLCGTSQTLKNICCWVNWQSKTDT